MKKKFFFSAFIVVIALSSSIVSLKVLQSHSIQSFLMYDFNKDVYNVVYDQFSGFNDNIPNITSTALPMKFLKARYYLKIDSIFKAKRLLRDAIKANPFIKAPEEMLARIFLNEKNYDSALYFSKEAFTKMPNANPHRSTYFTVLRHFNDSISLDNAFNIIREYNNPNHWYDYIYSKFKISPSHGQLSILADEFKKKFPNEDFKTIKELLNFSGVGGEAYTISSLLSNIADEKFKEELYAEAASLYDKAIDFNKENYLLFENAAIAYDLSQNIEKATDYYNKVIYEYKSDDGRAEFYKGLMLMRNNDMKGCQYLKSSSQKKYIGKNTKISASNVYLGLCLRNSNN